MLVWAKGLIATLMIGTVAAGGYGASFLLDKKEEKKLKVNEYGEELELSDDYDVLSEYVLQGNNVENRNCDRKVKNKKTQEEKIFRGGCDEWAKNIGNSDE